MVFVKQIVGGVGAKQIGQMSQASPWRCACNTGLNKHNSLSLVCSLKQWWVGTRTRYRIVQ